MERKSILGLALRQMMDELRRKRIEALLVPFGISPRQSYTPKSQYPLKRDEKGRMMKAGKGGV